MVQTSDLQLGLKLRIELGFLIKDTGFDHSIAKGQYRASTAQQVPLMFMQFTGCESATI